MKFSIVNGYQTVELFNDKGSKRLLVHRLVAKAFIPNPNNLPIVNHKDESRDNNNVDNLEWCTHQYNMTYGTAPQRRVAHTDYTKPFYRENAIKNGKKVSKPVIQISKEGEIMNRFDSIKDATKFLNVDYAHISECCRGKRKTSNGFIWKFERGNDLSQLQF